MMKGEGFMGDYEAVCRDAEGALGCKLSRGGSLGCEREDWLWRRSEAAVRGQVG